MEVPRYRRWFTHLLAPAIVGYGIFLAVVGEFRVEHGIVMVPWLALIYVPKLHKWSVLLVPFFLQAILYDALRFITPIAHSIIPPHVEGPYRIEAALFGITQADGTVITPPEYFLTHNWPVADVIAGFSYAGYMFVHMGLAIYLLFKDHETLWRFGWTFLSCILASFVIYYLYPAAPPWYVVEHGFGPAILDTPSNPARLADVDALLGISYFDGMYNRSSNVFAAIPSMHPIYPMMAWFFTGKWFPRLQWFVLAFVATICASAVYLCHHYIIDVVLGVALGTLMYFVAGRILDWFEARRTPATQASEATDATA